MYWDRRGLFRRLSLLLAVIMVAAALFTAPGVNPAGAAVSPAESAIEFLQNEYTTNGLVNADEGVGSYALYVLIQAGVDVGAWEYEGTSLDEAVVNAINGDISDPAELSAKLLAQDLAAADALGEDGLADQLAQILQDRESSAGFDGSPYSDIPAYDLLGRVGKLSVADESYAKGCILSAQNTSVSDAAYGSFGSTLDEVFYADFMTTAQAVRVLHYLDPSGSDSEIQAAIDAALGWMEDTQQDDGSFLGSAWDDPVIDTAEVVVALDALGMDPEIWDSGGYTAIDYMMNDALNDDGSFGTSKNVMDATWVLSAYNLMDITISPADYAIKFLQNEYTANGLVNTDDGVGSCALYVLIQAGVDVGAWEYEGTSLDEAVVSAISGDISNPSGLSAKLLAQDLAAAVALGENSLADQLAQILQAREGSTGFDSSIYSDAPAYDLIGRAGSITAFNIDYAKECLLAAQNTTAADPNSGSFGSTWDEVIYPDFMTTAQAVRALQYLDPSGSDGEIQTAIDAALDWLEDKQQDDGSFSGSDWDDPAIDTAEVIITLAALGMDPAEWESGSGNTAVDYMMNDALNDDGSFGTSKNVMDATWALCAYNLLDTQFYLSPSGTTLNVGGTKQFEAVWQGVDGTVNVTDAARWSVADETIVSVSGGGLVTALKAGRTEVSAVYGGLTASVGVTVKSSSPGGPGGNKRTVYLAVVGKDSEVLCSPKKVSVSESNEWGFTALGALDASGLSYQTSSWSYGVLVYSIEGQANSGMSGWMFTVNDVTPTVGSDKYDIDADDKIIFYYSRSMDQEPPQWSDLEKQTSIPGGSSGGLPAPLIDSDFNAAVKNAAAAGRVNLKSAQNEISLVLTMDQVSKVLDTGKPLAVTIQGAQFILSPESLKAAELVDEDAAILEFEAKKLSGEEVSALPSPSSFRLKIAGEIYELTIRVVNEDGTQRDIAHFPGCMVLLPVPAGMEESAAAGMLKAYYYNEESGQWEDMGGTYDPDNKVVGFNVDHFSKYALMEFLKENVSQPEEVAFIDIAGHWAQKEIEYMAAKGYVAGVGENQFAPESKITRAEFASILARMAGLEPAAPAAERFSDVPADAWYRGAVGAAATAGLVYGKSENSFAPDEPITREQMASMLVRFMAKKGSAAAISDTDTAEMLAGFSDAGEISGWASLPVASAVRDGLMVGRDNGMFIPLGDATRAEATVVLYRVLQKLPPAA